MFDAYKIGVTLSLTNHVSKGLMAMAGDFAKTEAQATLLQKRINSIKNDALKGGLMIGAGVGMLALLKGPYEEAKKLAQAQADFQTLNLSGAENAEAFGKAASMSHKILGTTITENVKLVHDLHTAFGDLHHAIGTADMFSQMSIVARVANGGAPVDGLVNAAAKALEHRGGKVINDPAAFEAEASLMTKVMLATKMRVSPKDYLTASGTGKMAYQLFDKEYLYGNFAGQMAINGGARTGTEAMTAFSSLIGGHMDSKGKSFLADLGLWQEGFSKKRLGLMHDALAGLSPEERQVAVASMGGQGAISGGLRDADAELYAHRPDLFIQKMIPLVRARFGMDLTDEQISLLVAKNLNRSAGNFLGTQITMASKLAKDTAIINKSMGIGDAYQHYMKSPVGAEEAAHAAWKNFLAVFGTVYLPAITTGLLKLASGLDKLSQWVDRNQGLVRGLVYAFAALAGGLVLRGSVLLLSAAFRGLGLAMVFNLTGIAARVAAFAAGPSSLGVFGAAIGALASPIGIAVLALGVLLAAIYAYRPLSKQEIDAAKFQGGAKLTAGAAARIANGELAAAHGMPKPWLPFGALPPASSKSVQVNSTINIDGRKVADVVTNHQSRAASRPQTGSGNFNSDMTPIQPGTTR